MDTIVTLLHSSIGKKFLVGLTGLCLCIYLVVHVGGNLLLFKQDGGAAFNTYAEVLPSLLIINIIEYVLFGIFIAHSVTGTYLWMLNKRARPEKYEVNKPQDNSKLSSRVMFVTGSIVFIFLVVHMRSFWFPSRFLSDQPGMYTLVKEAFANPVYGGFYVLAMILLGVHLRHGFQSALQTFGVKNAKYTSIIEITGALFWLVIPALFAAMPVYFFLMNS